MIRIVKGLRAARLGLLFLAAFVALATLIGGAGTGSAATASIAKSRVGASTLTVANVVGTGQGITAGQRLGNTVLQAEVVVATGVAAKSGDELANGTAARIGDI